MDRFLYIQDARMVAVYLFRDNDFYVYLQKRDSFCKENLENSEWFRLLHRDGVPFSIEEFSPDIVKELAPTNKNQLSFVFVEVNRRCNLGCIHCYVSEKRKGEALSYSQFDIISNKLHDIQPIDVRLIGGEPFLNNDLVAICERCLKIKPKRQHVLLTNCTMDEILLRKIIKTGISLQISVYGMTWETYKNFSNGTVKDYNNLFRNLEILSKEYNDKVKLVYINCDVTKHELSDFINFSKNKHFAYAYGGVMQIGRAKRNKKKLGEGFVEENPELPFAQKINNKICDLNRLCICANGDVTPCHYFQIDDRDFIMGNIFNDSINDILTCERYKKFQSYTVDDVAECRKCVLRYLCSAGCCGETFSVGGDVLGKYAHCKMDECYAGLKDGYLYRVRKKRAGSFMLDIVNKNK